METGKLQQYRDLIEKASVGSVSPEELLSSLDRIMFQMTEEERSMAPPLYSDNVTD